MVASLVAAGLSLAVLIVIFVPLERMFPARRKQPIFRPHIAVDACFIFGQYFVWNSVAFALLGVTSALIAAHVPSAFWAWVAARPLWVTGPLAIVLGDLLVYAFHRACHSFDFLWRFHAVHHSSLHLDWLAAHREHPVDGTLTMLCQNLPAFILGVPIEALAAFVAFRGMWAIFIHSNVRLPLGPLRWVFGAPELHHWHHAATSRTTHNFANVAPWIDIVCGTHHMPEPEAMETYALGLDEPWPKGYAAQLLHPFVLVARQDAPRLARRAVQWLVRVTAPGRALRHDHFARRMSLPTDAK
jgi:sterol desaturase/sphingolipid hydroxylase (fatty acid hydroxylase superfamily)